MADIVLTSVFVGSFHYTQHIIFQNGIQHVYDIQCFAVFNVTFCCNKSSPFPCFKDDNEATSLKSSGIGQVAAQSPAPVFASPTAKMPFPSASAGLASETAAKSSANESQAKEQPPETTSTSAPIQAPAGLQKKVSTALFEEAFAPFSFWCK